MTHAESCPLARAVDAVTEADRAWFGQHPQAPLRWRRVTRPEVTEIHLQNPDDALAMGWWVKVVSMPWGRVRAFCALGPGCADHDRAGDPFAGLDGLLPPELMAALREDRGRLP